MATNLGTPMKRREYEQPGKTPDTSGMCRCDKLMQIGNWQRCLREFMQNDARLSDLVSLYGQKFVQVGENKNFTLSTLTDMAWTVLVLTWEAILENKLPLVDEVEHGFQKRYQDLRAQFNQCRGDFLSEISTMRDQKRAKKWNDSMQHALEDADLGNDDVFSFIPENAMDEQTKLYFKKAMEEKVKMSLIAGAAAGEQNNQDLKKKMKALNEEIAELQTKFELMEADRDRVALELEESHHGNRKPVSKEVPVQDPRIQADLDQAVQDKVKLEAKVAKMLKLLRSLGFDGDLDDHIDVDAIKKGWNDVQEVVRPASAHSHHSADAKLAKAEQQLQNVQKELLANQGKAKELQAEVEKAVKEGEKFKKLAQEKEQEATKMKAEMQELKEAAQKAQEEAAEASKKPGDTAKTKTKEVIKEKIVYKDMPKVETQGVGVQTDPWKPEAAPQEKKVEKQEVIVYKPEHDEEAEKKRKAEEIAHEKERLRLEKEKANLSEAGKKQHEEDEKRRLDEEERHRKQQDKLKQAAEAAAEGADAAAERFAKEKAKLKSQLEEKNQEEIRLKMKIENMHKDMQEAKMIQKKLEMSLNELKGKFEDLKHKLLDRGVDTSIIEEALEECGLDKIVSGPFINVFDRLYHDAMKRRRSRLPEPMEFAPLPGSKEAREAAKLKGGFADAARRARFAASPSPEGHWDGGGAGDDDEDDGEFYDGDPGDYGQGYEGHGGDYGQEYGGHGQGHGYVDSLNEPRNTQPSNAGFSRASMRPRPGALVVPLGPPMDCATTCDDVHVWTRSSVAATKIMVAASGARVYGAPYLVDGIRWLLVWNLSASEWRQIEPSTCESLKGGSWILIDAAPVGGTGELLAPISPLAGGNAEQEYHPPRLSTRPSMYRSDTRGSHLSGHSRGESVNRASVIHNPLSLNVLGRDGGHGIVGLGPAEESHSSRSRTQSNSHSSHSGSASFAGSRPNSRERQSTSPGPTAIRAARANQMFHEGARNSEGSPSRPRSTLGEIPASHLVNDAFPFREPRRSAIGEHRSASPSVDFANAQQIVDRSPDRPSIAQPRRSYSPELGRASVRGSVAISSDSVAGKSYKEVKWTALDEDPSGAYPLRIQSSSEVPAKPPRSRSPVDRSVANFRPLGPVSPFDPEPGITRKSVSATSIEQSLAGISDAPHVASGAMTSVLQLKRSTSLFGDVNELTVGASGNQSQIAQVRGRLQSPTVPLTEASNSGVRTITMLSSDVFGGVSEHRRGHKDCTPPPLKPFKDVSRPQTSPSVPASGASLLPLQTRKTRWIGHDSSQLLPLTPITKALIDDMEAANGTFAGRPHLVSTVTARASANDGDANVKPDTKFLPQLAADPAPQGLMRPLGGAKTTGKLLTRSSTTGTLATGKGRDSRKFFLLKGVPAQRPDTPPAHTMAPLPS